MFFKKKKERQDRLEKATQWGVLVMDQYLRSREKHKDKLTIFDGPGMDNNINLLCETIYLLGVFDALVRYWDIEFKYLNPEDSVGILNEVFKNTEGFEGYDTWLEQALINGTYSVGAYQMKDPRLEYNDILFTAGQLSFAKLKDIREEVLVPELLGNKTDYDDFYDFRDFELLNQRFKAGLKEN